MLAEVAERDARGTVAEIYEDIRAVFGVGFVVLVYRALATDEARLQGAWEAVRPNLLSDEGSRVARALGSEAAVPVAPVAQSVLKQSCLDRGLLLETLAAFHRVNTRNVIALAALRDGHEGATPARRAPAPVAAASPILPMADLASVPPEVNGLLREFSAPITGGREPIVIPSLLRYLAPDQRLLASVWKSLRPTLTAASFDGQVDAMQQRIKVASQTLPYAVPRCTEEGARAIIEDFLRTIPAMVVTAPLIAAALGVDIND